MKKYYSVIDWETDGHIMIGSKMAYFSSEKEAEDFMETLPKGIYKIDIFYVVKE